MEEELKVRIDKGERLAIREPQKMTAEEIRAELQARLDSALDEYVAESYRSVRLSETTSKQRT